MTEAASSIILEADLSVMCNDVITKRQKPSKLADVPRICLDVLFAMWRNIKSKVKID
jgi:hypothetical protein